MIQLPFEKPVYGEVYRQALPYLQTRHNDVHVPISYGFALRLLANEEGDPEVVVPAVLLHDVGWSQVPEDRQLSAFGPNPTHPELTRVHEIEGARIASTILRGLGYAEALVEEAAEIIAGHDTRLTSLGRNDELVKDADKLFRLEARGFRIDCGRFGLDPAAHLEWLEDRIEHWFFTKAAKRFAREECAARRREFEPPHVLAGRAP